MPPKHKTKAKSKRRVAKVPPPSLKSPQVIASSDFYLPNDCWESIFKFIIISKAGNYNPVPHCCFDSLSVVSKQFLSITNHLQFSLRVYQETRPLLSRFFRRFTNLTSLNLACYEGDLNKLLREISCFQLKLTSLNLSTIPADGLRAFSKNITTLTSLTCSRVKFIHGTDLFLIADCFPQLQELDLSRPEILENHCASLLNGIKALSSALFKLRKVNLSGHYYINDQSLFHLFNKRKLLEDVVILYCHQITKAGIAAAIRDRPTLRSLSFSIQNDSATLFALPALVSNSPSLSKISLNFNSKYETSDENSDHLTDVVQSPQLESLCLAHNHDGLRDENLKIMVSLFPNLQLLNLSGCSNISENVIPQVLKKCSKIRHLDLSGCSKTTLLGLNFEVPTLEVLNLSYTSVDDEMLYVISKSCLGLLHLVLKYCHEVTEKGVKHVVKNCTQLREIDLWGCLKLNDTKTLHSSRMLVRNYFGEV